MSTPNRWVGRVERYLEYRRNCGFALTTNGMILRSFARFADRARPQTRLTVALVIAWSKTAKACKPVTWTRRVQILRGFAQYWLRFDPMTEVPPREIFGCVPYHRPMPHIFSDEEIVALMKATRRLLSSNHPLRQQTCCTLFGLLATTGLRVSEAINLKRVDVDLKAGVLTVREGKCHKSRLVALHPSNTVALRSYSQLRDRSVPLPRSDRFFLLDHGRPVKREAVRYALQSLCRRLGWHPRGDYHRHRVQDMRHTYIVHSIVRFYRQGIPIDRKLLALHTYVGHATIKETYWYCSAIPELMGIASKRFRRHLLAGRP